MPYDFRLSYRSSFVKDIFAQNLPIHQRFNIDFARGKKRGAALSLESAPNRWLNHAPESQLLCELLLPASGPFVGRDPAISRMEKRQRIWAYLRSGEFSRGPIQVELT
jgi:hypothetical protein